MPEQNSAGIRQISAGIATLDVAVLLALCVAMHLCRCCYLSALTLELVDPYMHQFAFFRYLLSRFSHSCSYSAGVVMMMLLECYGVAQVLKFNQLLSQSIVVAICYNQVG